ncbi:MAG TPA: hypothetical protein VJM31_06605 [Vicinamibacterales bacterium]|nr:hypothetical protein [Vicinamibacterales bacterium]
MCTQSPHSSHLVIVPSGDPGNVLAEVTSERVSRTRFIVPHQLSAPQRVSAASHITTLRGIALAIQEREHSRRAGAHAKAANP